MVWFSIGLITGQRVMRSRPGNRFATARKVRPLYLEPLEARTLLTGTWTLLSNLAPEKITDLMLLSDGTVMAQSGIEEQPGKNWYQLTPDNTGSYVNGTWSQLASMTSTRVYYPSNVLPDGRVFVAGGEYGQGTNKGEVYDPVADAWTSTPNGPLGDIGDVPSTTLPDGRVLVGYRFDGRTNIYDPATNTWMPGPTKDDPADEESWVKLADETVLNVEVFHVPLAEKYIPSENRWVSAGSLPVSLIEGSELGAGLLLPDGRAFFLGANGHTALYTPPANPDDPGSWAAGPDIPGNHGVWDAPAAMLPNGRVFASVGPHNYNGPTSFYEYDPVANSWTSVSSPSFTGPPYIGRMLTLPSGDILYSNSANQLYVYTPDGAPDPSWQPVITDVTDNGDGTFLLTGTQLNGISEGAAYGDDAEMSSNYPVIQLVDGNGNVSYGRTFNWSSTDVQTGSTPVSTYFTLPAGISAGDYSLSVVANGIASAPVDFMIGPSVPRGVAVLPVQATGISPVRAVVATVESGSPASVQPPQVFADPANNPEPGAFTVSPLVGATVRGNSAEQATDTIFAGDPLGLGADLG
jgi:hypothetical protein